jgi:hypothetical protein
MNCLEQDVKRRIAERLAVADDHRPGGESHRRSTWAAAVASTATAVSGVVPTAPISAATSTLPAAATPPATSRCGRSRSCTRSSTTRSKGRDGRAHHRRRDARGDRVSREGDLLCASAVASTFILLNSKSTAFRTGFGNDSGELGHNLMDHHFKVGAAGNFDGFPTNIYRGSARTASTSRGSAISTRKTKQKDYLRGFGYQGSASRTDWASTSRNSATSARSLRPT